MVTATTIGPVFSDIEGEIAQARAYRIAAQQEIARQKMIVDQEMRPLWARITARVVDNGIGEDYEIALRPRRR